MNNNERFERLYNELEDLLRVKYGLDPTSSAIYFYETRIGGPQAKQLRVLRELRNFMVHEKKPDVLEACMATEEALGFLERMIDDLHHPKLAHHVCIPRDKILFAVKSTPVVGLMKSMLERNISHVPVLDATGIVYGVFSGATMFAVVSADGRMTIGSETTVAAFDAALPIHKHIGERYWFISRTAPIEEIISLFGSTMKDGKKLKMLFVTENGKPTEKVLGLITPWDILDDDVVPAR